MAKPKRICSVDGCGKLHKGLGFCQGHYLRLKIKGRVDGHEPLRATNFAYQYMIDHMHDECPKWPYARGSNGYGSIGFGGLTRNVHSVVCEMVNGPKPSPSHQAAHICGKGHEGCFGARCLVWKTPSANMGDKLIHGTQPHGKEVHLAKLDEEDVLKIRKMAGIITQARLAEMFGTHQSNVSNIVRGKTWRHLL